MPDSTRPTLSSEPTRFGSSSQSTKSARLEHALGREARFREDPRARVTLLQELVRATEPSSLVGARARLVLTSTLLSGDPGLGAPTAALAFGCARHCREARRGPLSRAERAWSHALCGTAFSLLGCFRAARREYQHALKEDPDDPVVAHNLGHLLHVKLGQPRAALRWLRQAHAELPREPEVAASFAYALVATGEHERALDVLAPALGSRSLARATLERWLEATHPTVSGRNGS